MRSFFLIPGLLGWFVLSSGRGRRILSALGAVLIFYGCVVGAAISVYGYYDALRTTHPGTYWSLDRLSSPLPTALTMILGHPVIARTFPVGDQIRPRERWNVSPRHHGFRALELPGRSRHRFTARRPLDTRSYVYAGSRRPGPARSRSRSKKATDSYTRSRSGTRRPVSP